MLLTLILIDGLAPKKILIFLGFELIASTALQKVTEFAKSEKSKVTGTQKLLKANSPFVRETNNQRMQTCITHANRNRCEEARRRVWGGTRTFKSKNINHIWHFLINDDGH
jgi:hypothetical protein